MSRYRIEPILASHSVETLDCGEEALNRFLIRFALATNGPVPADSADGAGPAGRGG